MPDRDQRQQHRRGLRKNHRESGSGDREMAYQPKNSEPERLNAKEDQACGSGPSKAPRPAGPRARAPTRLVTTLHSRIVQSVTRISLALRMITIRQFPLFAGWTTPSPFGEGWGEGLAAAS